MGVREISKLTLLTTVADRCFEHVLHAFLDRRITNLAIGASGIIRKTEITGEDPVGDVPSNTVSNNTNSIGQSIWAVALQTSEIGQA